MAIKREDRIVTSLSLSSVARKRSVWVTSDGEEFSVKKDAMSHETKALIIINFKKIFSEAQGNFRAGTEALSRLLLPIKGKAEYEDYFWVKIDSHEEERMLGKLCSDFYKSICKGSLFNADKNLRGWVYVIALNTHSTNSNSWKWVSLGTLKKTVRTIERSYPDNDTKTLQPLKKHESLLDFED